MEDHRPAKQYKSIRLPHYDYSLAGGYAVTIVTTNRECLFGRIADGEMELNEWGSIIAEEWRRSEEIRAEITLDEFIVMPNHFHGIVFINDGVHCRATLPGGNSIPRSLNEDHTL